MRVLAISHQADAGPGVFAQEVRAAGHALDEWLLPTGGSSPADPAGYDAVMTFGGAMHSDQEETHPWLRDEKALLARLIEDGVPLLPSAWARSSWPRRPGRRPSARLRPRSAGSTSS